VSEDSLLEQVIAAAQQCELSVFAGTHLGLDSGKDSGQKLRGSLYSRTCVIRKCAALASLSSQIKRLLAGNLEESVFADARCGRIT
jgi:hypothetical protein